MENPNFNEISTKEAVPNTIVDGGTVVKVRVMEQETVCSSYTAPSSVTSDNTMIEKAELSGPGVSRTNTPPNLKTQVLLPSSAPAPA